MKFSYRSHPFLKILKDKRPGSLNIADIDGQVFGAHSPDIRKFLIENADAGLKNIKVLTGPFIDAVEASISKLNKPEFMLEIKNTTGVLMYKSMAHLYKWVNEPNHIRFESLTVYDDVIMSYALDSLIVGVEEKNVKAESNGTTLPINSRYMVMANLLFIQFADLETRYVNGNSKNTDAGKEKLVNETEFKIEMLDSTWFTNIVRSEGFAVHGHFRMQACGPNHSQRKLTYINDFEKKGYTRRAKKTIEGDQPVNSIPPDLG